MRGSSIGGAQGESEYERFITGRGCYVDDIKLASMAYMHVVRSPFAHADIRSIDISMAAAADGVVAVLTGVDLATDGVGTIPCVSRPRTADFRVQSIIEPGYAALARDRVRMVGEGVAIVIAETAAAAEDAGELIEVIYEALPAVVESGAAVESTAPRLWPEAPGNVSFTYQLGDAAGVSSALCKAQRVARRRIDISRVSANPLEPRSVIGSFDPRARSFTIYVGHQTPHQMRHVLARRIFDVPEHRMRVVCPDIGGGFGLKSGLFPEDILTLWAAARIGRPVKWICDRSEAFLSDDHARETIVDAALAIDDDGKFLALEYRALANLGAYVAFRGAHPPTNNLGSLSGVYILPAVFAEVKGVFTNTRPTSSYRGAGRPEATYVLERMIDVAAASFGLDRFELRRRNLIDPRQMPYKTPLLFTYDSGDFGSNMEKCEAIIDRAGIQERKALSKSRGLLRGLGFANSIEQAGGPVGSPWEERVELRFDLSGGVRVLVGTMASGQNHGAAFREIVRSRLGIDPDLIEITQGDTDVTPFGRGSFGSRSMMAGGSAIVRACEKAVFKGKIFAAGLMQTDTDRVAFVQGNFRNVDTGASVTFSQVLQAAFNVASLPAGLEGGLDELATFAPPAPTYPNSCHACEVEIDPETGETQLRRYVVVDDVGAVLDHASVEGQVQGGVAQGIGQCFGEFVRYDKDGQLVTGSFMDYAMPRADDVPACETTINSTSTRNNPLGVKGAGEAGTIGAIPTVMNAIADALSELGVTHFDMPATPQRIWAAVRAARRSYEQQ